MESTTLLATAYTVLAQAYGCGDYGESSYNKCETSTSGGSSGSSGNGSGGQGQGGDSSTSSSSNTDSTSTTPSDTSTTTPSDTSTTQEQTQQPSNSFPTQVASQVAGTPWGILLPIILFLTLLFSFLIYLWKRRRHGDDNLPPNGGFTPPSV